MKHTMSIIDEAGEPNATVILCFYFQWYLLVKMLFCPWFLYRCFISVLFLFLLLLHLMVIELLPSLCRLHLSVNVSQYHLFLMKIPILSKTWVLWEWKISILQTLKTLCSFLPFKIRLLELLPNHCVSFPS
jgi:hypothetical protein